MLMALLLATLLGKGGVLFFTDAELKQVKRVIGEDARAESVRQAMRRSNERLEDLIGERSAAIDGAAAVLADPRATRAEVDEVLASLESARDQALDAYLEAVFAMRRQMSREEWREAFGVATSE